ncbi:sensor histidine kinase [Pseudonocardia humida]|uniref:histidine kinase n=1 Tax=Pseudonocardia humida TaxID=2800819 RepID=A0ABT1A7E9_9PSEU|nr:ATP-binding protein [Pseudonocardia humida]MCO1658951.1 histidine kinase [Pseudonocardia humida]
MRPGAAALGVLAAVPVCWAALAARPGRLAAVEAVLLPALLVVGVPAAARRPTAVLAAAAAAWIAVFVPRAEDDSLLGAAAFAGGLAVLALLAGRYPLAGRRDPAVLVLGPCAAAATALGATGGIDTALAAAVGVSVLSVVPWTAGRHLARHDELVRAGWERARLWEREAERAVEVARGRERDRLAGEMHDLIGHELARVALGVGALEVDPGLDAGRRAAAGRARQGVTAAAERLADVVRMLRTDAALADDGPVAEVVERARQAGLDVAVVGDPAEPQEPVIAATVRRVLSEALTNAMKHAPGAPVRVGVDADVDGLRLSVRTGAPPATPGSPPGSGSGLTGLAERVRLVGGRFAAGPAPDGGWTLTAELPAAPGPPAPVSDTELRHRRARETVQRSGWRAVLVAAGVGAAGTALVAGYMVVDAATSVLDPADFARLAVGQPRSAVAAVLPARTRTDDPTTGVPAPAGAVCEHYSTHADPFDARRADLFRLCFVDGILVGKDVLVRSADTDPGR